MWREGRGQKAVKRGRWHGDKARGQVPGAQAWAEGQWGSPCLAQVPGAPGVVTDGQQVGGTLRAPRPQPRASGPSALSVPTKNDNKATKEEGLG